MSRSRTSLLSLVIATIGVEGSACGQCADQTFTGPDAELRDRFGLAVALDGDVMLVGAPGHDAPAADEGAAYVYRRSGSTWTFEAKLLAPAGAETDRFGQAVTIAGDEAFVAAPFTLDGGRVHVFRHDGVAWTFFQTLAAPGVSFGDRFGASLAVDGDVLVVGAPDNDVFGGAAGAAYVYRRTEGSWPLETVLHGDDAADGDWFGAAVAVDDDRIAVGAPLNPVFGPGKAYLFRYDGAAWAQETQLVSPDSEVGDLFGIAVGLDGGRVAVSALLDGGPVSIFEEVDGFWLRTAALGITTGSPSDRFGFRLQFDSGRVLVSAHESGFLAADGGAAYLFEPDGDTWTLAAQIVPSMLQDDDFFGLGLAMQGDEIVVGAPSTTTFAVSPGVVFVFDRPAITGPDCDGDGIADPCAIAADIVPDCNGNDIPDECDIASGTSGDCDANGVPDDCQEDCNDNGVLDSCDIADGTSPDCNGNGIPDECDVTDGTSLDCNDNGVPDECDLDAGTSPDCNGNGVPDECDIASGSSADCNGNGIPDFCDFVAGVSVDCNGNQRPDECDIADGTSADADGDGVPDECQTDCNDNGVPDFIDIAFGLSPDCNDNGVPDECDVDDGTGPDCNGNGVPDECDVADGTSPDCNDNGVPDECDVASGTSTDINGNGIPDECEEDCNDNGIPDFIEILFGSADDCNGNEVPDECDIADGRSADCDGNGVPDECDIASGTSPDCNSNGVPDPCEVASGEAADCNDNGVPDECDVASGTSPDCDGNGIPDECDIADGAEDCNDNGIPDTCEVVVAIAADSGDLSPIGTGFSQTFVVVDPPPALTDVWLRFTATADLAGSSEFVNVSINGLIVATIFDFGAGDCPGVPDADAIVLTPEAFDDLIGTAGAAIIKMTASAGVDPGACGGTSTIRVILEYDGRSAADLDGDGVLDECECPEDLDGDGMVAFTDLVTVLAAWGPCPPERPCSADLDGSGDVGFTDLIAVLSAWGTCE